MKQVSEQEMLHRMAGYCSTAERCIQEVGKKIRHAGLPPEAEQRIIHRLTAEKFIDESRFAASFVHDALRFNRWGRIKIAYELKRRGIPSGICTEALAMIDDEAYRATLLAVLKEKEKTVKGKDGRDRFHKLLRFAAGRGFESHEAIRCLRGLFNGNDYAGDME
ncbi:MAG: RecX family transcriptional regulator [Tannerellaceae bacterium]|jgi:regulatory protein|nr:RecX family transcriptional regulator [Tannerellaceae bacterium]